MNRTIVVPISLLLVITITPSLLSNASLMTRTAPLGARSSVGSVAAAAYGKLPVSFEPNLGQSDRRVKFLSRGPGYALFLTPTEAVLTLHKRSNDSRATGFRGASTDFRLAVGVAQKMKSRLGEPETSSVLRIELIGANRKPTLDGINPLPGKVNYFTGKNPARWRRNIPTFSRVKYQQVYPGVDLVYYGNQRQLEYDFVVTPGADPQQIELSFDGADRLRLDANGNLIASIAGGKVVEHKPVIYQDIDGMRRRIGGGYEFKDGHHIGFKLARYDHNRTLIIDPSLVYSTYIGGSGAEGGLGIAVDTSGNAYITGVNSFGDFPTTPGAVQSSTPIGKFGYAFVTKLNSSGSALIYSTYLGGSNDGGGDGDQGLSIAVDSSGNAYISGQTDSSDFPITAGAFDTTLGKLGTKAFVTKLNSDGSALVYSTYLGGNDFDSGSGIALDSARNAYIAGITSSTDFPTTQGAFQTTPEGLLNVFVTKLNSGGSALVYSTYLGGSDVADGIALDSAGNAYTTGFVYSSNNFPITPGAFDTTCCGAFVTKLNSSGSALVYSTYLGVGGLAIAVDPSGNAYLTGLGTLASKLNSTGSSLVYSKLIPGNGEGIAVDSVGNAYVTGATESSKFPTTPDAFQTTYGGPPPQALFGDAFVTKLNSSGSIVYSTYLGGSNDDGGSGIAVDLAGNAYVTGATSSANFPTTGGAFQSTFAGNLDAFVTKLALATFAGQPGAPNCHGKSVSGLAQKYGGMDSAASALGLPSVKALQDAIKAFCGAER
jgi:hypothetical protein